MNQLYDYHVWANERMLDHLASYPSVFTKPMAGPFSSIARTFEHIYDVDRIWFSRMKESSEPAGGETTFSTAAEAKKAFTDLGKEMSRFLQEVRSGDTMINYRTKEGVLFQNTLSELVTHVVNHGTSHRGNVVAMLRTAGYGSCPTDFIYFLRDNPST
ncbi:DinB family protein [Domibacillus indicus]|uniref:DinB family protein n=1 Tax=Domibacillus indicus TaxID=1437523 RepID=UPI002041BF7F|nr:DinB family protein [Domibacillus indicus]MCM3790624.1 DinB family protein [Domibacillus indicus]